MDKEAIAKLIGSYPDFPQPGILFRDIHPVLRHPEARSTVVSWLVERYKGDFRPIFVFKRKTF